MIKLFDGCALHITIKPLNNNNKIGMTKISAFNSTLVA